jgi:synaptotagmin-7
MLAVNMWYNFVCAYACVGFSLNKLMTRTLYMQVLDYDRFSRDDPIGEICVPIGEVDLTTPQTMWRNLQPCKGHSVRIVLVTVYVALIM